MNLIARKDPKCWIDVAVERHLHYSEIDAEHESALSAVVMFVHFLLFDQLSSKFHCRWSASRFTAARKRDHAGAYPCLYSAGV